MSISSGATWRRAVPCCAACWKAPIEQSFFYGLAALAEIAGCFAVWVVLRDGRNAWWLAPGLLSLTVFAWALTRIDSDHAGRAFAAYGGIYITASLAWMWAVEGARPDRYDVSGLLLCLIGAGVILWAPRAG